VHISYAYPVLVGLSQSREGLLRRAHCRYAHHLPHLWLQFKLPFSYGLLDQVPRDSSGCIARAKLWSFLHHLLAKRRGGRNL